jgi:hypothetical protein
MVIRFFILAFAATLLWFSKSDRQHRTIAFHQDVMPQYDASYKY